MFTLRANRCHSNTWLNTTEDKVHFGSRHKSTAVSTAVALCLVNEDNS